MSVQFIGQWLRTRGAEDIWSIRFGKSIPQSHGTACNGFSAFKTANLPNWDALKTSLDNSKL